MARRRKKANPFTLFSFQDIITSVMGIILLSALLLAVELTHRTPSSEAAVETAIDSLEASLEEVARDVAELELRLQAMTGDARRVAETFAPDLPQRKVVSSEQLKRMQGELAELSRAVERRRKEHERLTAGRFDRREDFRRLEELETEVAAAEAELLALQSSKRMFFNPAPGSSKQPWIVDYGESRILVGPLPSQNDKAQPLHFANVTELETFAGSLSPQDNYFLLLIRPSSVGSYERVVDRLKRRGFDLGFDLLADDQEVFPGHASP